MPTFFALIAQSVEHAAVNRGVTGSSPVWGAKENLVHQNEAFSFPCAIITFMLYYTQGGDSMKSIICFLCVVLLMASFTGCGKGGSSNPQNPQQTETQSDLEKKELSDEKLAEIVAKELGVPDNAGIESNITAEMYYFEAADRYYKNVLFTEKGETVAWASVDPYTGELLRNIFEYQD